MNKEQKLRTIMKFDTGADGFQKMIYVLAGAAIVVLIVGLFFLNTVIKDLRNLQ